MPPGSTPITCSGVAFVSDLVYMLMSTYKQVVFQEPIYQIVVQRLECIFPQEQCYI